MQDLVKIVREKEKEGPVWLTRDHRLVCIKDMTDAHLINTIRMLRRNKDYYLQRECDRAERYMANAPDGAYDAADQMITNLCKASTDEVLLHCIGAFKHLMAEATKRGLNLDQDNTSGTPDPGSPIR